MDRCVVLQEARRGYPSPALQVVVDPYDIVQVARAGAQAPRVTFLAC